MSIKLTLAQGTIKGCKQVCKSLHTALQIRFGYTVYSEEFNGMHATWSIREAFSWMRMYPTGRVCIYKGLSPAPIAARF